MKSGREIHIQFWKYFDLEFESNYNINKTFFIYIIITKKCLYDL